jgi:hypothetical protein
VHLAFRNCIRRDRHQPVYALRPVCVLLCRDGIAGSPKSPKYVKLTEVLLGYQHLPNAHGIIFIRTRNDARVLLSILQAGRSEYHPATARYPPGGAAS